MSKIYLPILIGLRYTRAKRRNQFISFISGFSLLGMLLGSIALIVVMSVMNGFDQEIKQRLLQVVPHVEVEAQAGIDDWFWLQQQLNDVDNVVYTAPYVAGHAMVSYKGGVKGVQLRGLLPTDLQRISAVGEHMIAGDLDTLAEGEFGIVIGRLLARYLGLNVGDKVNLILPQLIVTPAGVFPRIKRFTLVGVFEVGAQVDQNLVLVHLRDGQKLLRMGNAVQGIEIKTSDMYLATTVAQDIQHQLNTFEHKGSYNVTDWSQTQGSLFAAVKMEKTVVSVLLMIVIAVAAFNIISSLVLMVADKRVDIAVLRTLGLSRLQVMAIFVVQGAAIGWLGVILGAVIGAIIAFNIAEIVQFLEVITGLQIFDPNIYFISQLPSVVMWQDIILVVFVGACLSLLSTLYPAYRAAKVEPAEALRYE